MYFSRVRMAPEAHSVEKAVSFLNKGGYAVHQLLWQLFPNGPDAKRDFIYRQEWQNGWPVFYMVSQREPVPVNGTLSVETKHYDPMLTPGQRFGFTLRANPVVTRKKENGKRVRHDVVMDAKFQKRTQSDTGNSVLPSELIEMAGIKWLNERSNSLGFEIEGQATSVDGYLQHRFFKKGKKFPIRYSTIDYNGILNISDPTRFLKTLYEGIGHAKAFGCGLMLVRRI